jgi:hypothetical protein
VKRVRRWVATALILCSFLVALSGALLAGGCSERARTSERAKTPRDGGTTRETDSSREAAEASRSATRAANGQLVLYFPNRTVDRLVREERPFDASRPRAEQVVEALFAGPRTHEGLPFVPCGLSTPTVDVEGDTAIVHFGTDLATFYPVGQQPEELFVYAFVDSLVDSLGVSHVRFCVKGGTGGLPGDALVTKPEGFARNARLIDSASSSRP